MCKLHSAKKIEEPRIIMKRIVVLGSTGAVGQQALSVARTFPDQIQVIGLAAHTNHRLLAQQVEEFQPQLVSYSRDVLPDPPDILAARKMMTMEEMATASEADVVVIATVSAPAGLPVTLAAIQAGKTVVLANKEVMVMAGSLIMDAARRQKTALYPVDPALSGIWQALAGEPGSVKRVILTTTGEPMPSRLPLTLHTARTDSVSQPGSQVGKKARIDALTLMNVGMQAIEANRLFDIPYDAIEVLIHPQGLIRAMVEFADGSVKAILTQPTLFLPLQYALSHPQRWSNEELPPMDLAAVGHLSFHAADGETYPCLASALEAGRRGGTAPTVLNAANEMAVWSFLTQQIGLQEIPKLVNRVLSSHQAIAQPTLEDIYAADDWTRDEVQKHAVW